ncbi:28S ribosomal protein S24, mitochondrial isoform X8 [Balaenoptera acutorostrata]|uniref:28S ribosomal protein S24, mitochondrial isoform X8 n=1 Tax=Balaenoptera acutorostrata TaxID=9767 RepID=A0ABM3TV55_BALAC|nr:28S ribosomal protein S24, mitochondrial isoform X8 [Balaenoptera acutorostrata]
MAAPVCCRGLRPLVLSWSRELPCVWRALHTSAVCAKNRAARVRVGKGDKPVTYEQAHAPHHIAHRKGWLSLHTVSARHSFGGPRSVDGWWDWRPTTMLEGLYQGGLSTASMPGAQPHQLLQTPCLPGQSWTQGHGWAIGARRPMGMEGWFSKQSAVTRRHRDTSGARRSKS